MVVRPDEELLTEHFIVKYSNLIILMFLRSERMGYSFGVGITNMLPLGSRSGFLGGNYHSAIVYNYII